MMSVKVDEHLREQSKLLLRKLKEKQTKLQSFVTTTDVIPETQVNGVTEQFSVTSMKPRPVQASRKSPVRFGQWQDENCGSNLNEQLDTDLHKSLMGTPSREGRARLHRKRSKSREGTAQCYRDNNKENRVETSPKKSFYSKNIEIDTDEYANRHANIELSELRREVAAECMQDRRGDVPGDTGAASGGSETPNTVRRRRIIDKNVKVSSTVDLNASELLKECEDDFPRLNYSYSNVEDSDLIFLQERLGTGAGVTDADVPVRDTDPDLDQRSYSKNLDNPGNSRKIAKFIRETKKPKSILLSTSDRQSKSVSSNTSRVSFRSPTRDASGNSAFQMDSFSRQQQKMLGYDWIAALIDNDSNAINQSETFFEDLKEFRRLNLEECVNSMYMDSPQEMWAHPEREPLPVQRALEETNLIPDGIHRHEGERRGNVEFKYLAFGYNRNGYSEVQTLGLSEVKPYIVNGRLFPEPIKKSLFAEYDYPETDTSHVKEKEPTYDEPRFVRVSIPRSTLMSPYRVKPHRRSSFDGTDTMALSQHCLKGWNTTQPAMVPASSNIALRDSTKGIKSSMKTTLDDAEKLAANFPYHWDPAEQTICRPIPKPTYCPEASYADSSWPVALKNNTTASSGSAEGLKQATDDLLDSTYSLMYEMQRLKMERSDDPIRL